MVPLFTSSLCLLILYLKRQKRLVSKAFYAMVILCIFNIAILFITFSYRKKLKLNNFSDHIIILEIASTVLNLLIVLFVLFDFMEHNKDLFLKRLISQSSQLIWMIIFIAMAIIHAVVCIKIFIVSKKLNTNEKGS